MTVDMVVRAVYSVERKLFDWVMNEKRRKLIMELQECYANEMDKEE